MMRQSAKKEEGRGRGGEGLVGSAWGKTPTPSECLYVIDDKEKTRWNNRPLDRRAVGGLVGWRYLRSELCFLCR